MVRNVFLLCEMFRIMIATLSFLLDYENIEEDYDSDGSSSEDDLATQEPQVLLSREAIYKVCCQQYELFLLLLGLLVLDGPPEKLIFPCCFSSILMA